MEPLVSVVMPAYNASLHIREAVDSILNQTYKNIELIAVNDGSTDDTLDILNEYAKKDKRVVIVSRENKGVAESLNDGLKKASGKYIARMDADDCSLPHRIKTQVEFLESHPEIGICGANIYINDKSNIRKYPLTDEDIRKFLYLGSAFAHPVVMFRKSFVDDGVIHYNPDFPAEDYEQWTRLVLKTKAANIEEPLLIYRVDGNNISVRKLGLMLEASHRIRKNYCMATGVEYGLEAPFELHERVNEGKVVGYFKRVLSLPGDNSWCLEMVKSALFEALFYESKSFKDMKNKIMSFLDGFYETDSFSSEYSKMLKKKYIRRKIKLLIKRK